MAQPPATAPHIEQLALQNETTTSYATPMSLNSSPTSKTTPSYETPIPIPPDLTQSLVLSSPRLHRLQQDLLVLTSFNENSTLHWRPSWFAQDPHAASFWTLYNPPNVVTELLPHKKLGRLVYTRRMRREGDEEPMYVKSWEQWERMCDLRGVPRGWLGEEVSFFSLGSIVWVLMDNGGQLWGDCVYMCGIADVISLVRR